MSDGPLIVAAYKALKSTGRLRSVQMAEYRCRVRGCALAVVFQLPGTVACYAPAYKNSPALNESTSVPSARRKNTVDGDRRWPERGFDVRELAADAVGEMVLAILVQCDHHRGTLNPAEVLRDAGRPGGATRPNLL